MILGGHSAGASTAVAYAAWDFRGRPGVRDLAGLVLIDGGLLGSFSSSGLERARNELAEIRAGEVFLDLLGLGLPEINGIFAQVGALWAHKRPDEPSVLQQYPPLPAFLKPPFPVTNEAQFGYAFDETTSPDELSLIHIRAGRLAAGGDPSGWEDGEVTPIRRFARAYAADRPNATEWYYPRRLLLDIDAASSLRQTAGGELPRAAAAPRPPHRRAALRLQHRAHEGAGGAGREAARAHVAHRGALDRRRPRYEPPRSALRRAPP